MFDPAAVAEGRPPAGGPAPGLQILVRSPLGPGGFLPVELRFDRAVFDVAAPPEDVRLHVSRIDSEGRERPVAGKTVFPRVDRIQFIAEEDLPMAHEYVVRLEGEVHGAAGETISGTTWRFETERPGIDFEQGDNAAHLAELNPNEPAMLSPRRPIDPAALAEHVVATTPDGTKIPIDVRAATPAELRDADVHDDGGPVSVVVPVDGWPRERVTLRIDESVRFGDGPLGLAEPWMVRFDVTPAFAVEGLRCDEQDGDRCPLGAIAIQMSDRPADGWDKHVRVRPKPRNLEVRRNDWGEDPGISIDGDFVPGRRYRIVFDADLEAENEETLGRRQLVTVRFKPEIASGVASLDLSDTFGRFETVDEARIGILAHRVTEARVRLAVLPAAEAQSWFAAPSQQEMPWPATGEHATIDKDLTDEEHGVDTETVLDLGPFVKPGDVVLVEVAPTSFTPRTEGDAPPPVRGLFSVSGLGITTHVGPSRAVAHVTRLEDGTPARDVEVAVVDDKGTHPVGRTDASGIVQMPGAVSLGAGATVIAQTNGDAVASSAPYFRWPNPIGRVRPSSSHRAWREPTTPDLPEIPQLRKGERGLVGVAIGRGIYMRGDDVHIAGWASISTPHEDHSTRRAAVGTEVRLRLQFGGEVVEERTVEVSEHGRFAATLKVPKTARTGRYEAHAVFLGAEHSTVFYVAEPRIPTFETAVGVDRNTLLRGDDVELRAGAMYFSGEVVPIDTLHWDVTCRSSQPSMPALLDGFTVRSQAESVSFSDSGVLEPTVKFVEMPFATDALPNNRAMSCSYSATIQDASFQQAGSSSSFFVHPTPVYLAHRQRGRHTLDPIRIDVITVRPSGRRVAHPEVTVEVHQHELGDGVVEPPRLVGRCELAVGRFGAPARCELPPQPEGDYVTTLRTTVDGVDIEQVGTFWIREAYDYEIARAKERKSEPKPEPEPPPPPSFAIWMPDRVVAGKPAEIVITGPWKDADGMLAIEQTGLRRTMPFHLEGHEARVQVVPEIGQGPHLELLAWVPRAGRSHALASVRRVRASQRIEEPYRALEVTVKAPETARPGQSVGVKIHVADHEGHGTPARVAVWVVDDGLLSLRRPATPRLGDIFNPDRVGEREIVDTHDALLHPYAPYPFGSRGRRVPRVRAAKAQVKGGMDYEVREKFDKVPLFVGDAATDEHGDLELPLELPDNLTRWDINVVASSEIAGAKTGPARFGVGSTKLRTTTPLNVRVAMPRQLRPGDETRVTALVNAPVAGEVIADVEVLEGDVQVVGQTQGKVHVEEGGVAKLPFILRGSGPADAKVRILARLEPEDGGKRRTGGVQRTLPLLVERAAVDRAAVFGSLTTDRAVALPVKIPEAARTDVGGVSVSISASALGELEDSIRYLVEYPYGCLEQTSSQLLPLAALVGLAPYLPDGVDPREAATAGIERIASMQLDDGRFAYWPSQRSPAGFAEGYALWVLQMARDAGLTVPAEMLDRATAALTQLASTPLPTSSSWAPYQIASRAMLLMALGAEAPEEAIDAMYERRGDLQLDSRTMLAMAMHARDPRDARLDALLETVSASIETRAGVAVVGDRHHPRVLRAFESHARDQALVLILLLRARPDDPRIDKLARGLNSVRRAGRWRTTQENAFALVAMSRYAAARESEPVDARVRAWVGSRPTMSTHARGVDAPPAEGALAMGAVVGGLGTTRTTPVVVHREGTGRVYYRVGVQWTETDPPPRSQGLRLQTKLRAEAGEVDDQLQAGGRYALDVTIGSDAARHHVAVDVPLPAGLEAIDNLLGPHRIRTSSPRLPAEWSYRLSHTELLPDRVQLFFDELPPGEQTVTVYVLAATAGEYTVPPATAEAMYEPEIRARTSATRLTITP